MGITRKSTRLYWSRVYRYRRLTLRRADEIMRTVYIPAMTDFLFTKSAIERFLSGPEHTGLQSLIQAAPDE